MAEKKHFKEIIPFDAHSKANLQPVAILKKFKIFFPKNPFVFSQKPKILNVLKNLTIPVAFYGKFAKIQCKKIHVQKREPTPSFSASSIGKQRVRKTQLFERKILLSIFPI